MIHVLMILISLLFQLQSVVGASEVGGLKSVEWQHRVLAYVVSTESERASIERSLAFYSDEIEERDLLFVNLGEIDLETVHTLTISPEEKAMWRAFWDIDMSESRFVLIGKDGGAKAFQRNAVNLKLFFDLIDTMPMRKAEIREGGGFSQ